MKLRLVAGVALFLVGGAAQSASFVGDVDALANSSTGGVGRSTGIVLNPGDSFSILAAPTDLWNAGPLPRWSNANGLLGDLFATGTDDSFQATGVKIGQAFSSLTQYGLPPHTASWLAPSIAGRHFLRSVRVTARSFRASAPPP